MLRIRVKHSGSRGEVASEVEHKGREGRREEAVFVPLLPVFLFDYLGNEAQSAQKRNSGSAALFFALSEPF
jgi:hypothetical protein